MRVLVLGAGVVGTAAAWYLAEAGHEVTVLDREAGPARGTSYANAGQSLGASVQPWVSPAVPGTILRHFGRIDAPYLIHLKPDPAIWGWAVGFLRNCTRARVAEITASLKRLAILSLTEIRDLRAELDLHYDMRPGVLHVFSSQKEFDHAAGAAVREPEAARPVVHTREEAVALEPALAARPDLVAGGLHYAQDETGDCHLFTNRLAERAEEKGVAFHWGEAVEAVIVEGGRATGARAGRREFRADAVVMSLATGSAALLRPLGMRVPIYPVKGYAATMPAGPGAPEVALMDRDHKAGITRLGERLRIAGTAELAGYDPRLDKRRAGALLNIMMKRFPEGGDPSEAELWTGLRPMTPDCAPLLGECALPGLWLDTGHGSLGWTLACGSARVLAEMVSGRRSPIDLNGLTLGRFA